MVVCWGSEAEGGNRQGYVPPKAVYTSTKASKGVGEFARIG
jgi:hypothetical protein